MTADEALDHPYLAAYVSSNVFSCTTTPTSCEQHDPEDEPVVASLDPDYFDFDRKFLLFPVLRAFSFCFKLEYKEDLTKAELKGT